MGFLIESPWVERLPCREIPRRNPGALNRLQLAGPASKSQADLQADLTNDRAPSPGTNTHTHTHTRTSFTSFAVFCRWILCPLFAAYFLNFAMGPLLDLVRYVPKPYY